MKILHVATFHLGANGPTFVLKSLLKRLVQQGNEIGLLSTSLYDKQKENLLNKMGVKYYFKQSKGPFNKQSLLKCVPDFKTYDVIHLHGVFNFDNFIISRIAKSFNIPYVLSTHGNLMKMAIKRHKIKKLLYLNIFANKMLKEASKVHVLAVEEKIDLINLINDVKTEIIPNGVELSNKNLEKTNNNNNDKFKILFIGRLDVYHKGIDILLDSISQLESVIDDNNLEVILVGPFNRKQDKKYIINVITSNKYLQKVVKLEGPKYGTEKIILLNKADLFVHTSRLEGMPIAVLEAMSMGVPCLVTKETNMKEIILKSNGGFVTSLNSKEIANKIIDIIQNHKEKLPRIGQNAQKWCYENLNWDYIAEKYLQMYNSILKI